MAYFESLPYIDPEPSQESLSAARALILAEQSTSPPTPLPSLREASLPPLMETHISLLASGQSAPKLDLSRYESQDPDPDPAPRSPSSSPAALRRSLSNSAASSEYLASRAQNLSLLRSHGGNAWLMGNYALEAELRSLERELAETKREIDVLNAARAASQNGVKAEMLSLEQSWRTALGRVVETEIAVEEVRGRIREELRNRASAAPPSS